MVPVQTATTLFPSPCRPPPYLTLSQPERPPPQSLETVLGLCRHLSLLITSTVPPFPATGFRESLGIMSALLPSSGVTTYEVRHPSWSRSYEPHDSCLECRSQDLGRHLRTTCDPARTIHRILHLHRTYLDCFTQRPIGAPSETRHVRTSCGLKPGRSP